MTQSAESGSQTSIEMRQGRPTVIHNGEPVVMAAYCNSIAWDVVTWREWVDRFINSGIQVFHVNCGNDGDVYLESQFWTDEAEYPDVLPALDGLTLEAQVAYISGRVPAARFVVRLMAIAPARWSARNPGEMQTDSSGKTYQPSWASLKFLEGAARHFARVVGYCQSRPWGDAVLGYKIFPMGEGIQEHAVDGCFYDRSPAMQAAWQEYRARKFGPNNADEALPTDADLRAKIDVLPQWPPPTALSTERDYAELQRDLYFRYVTTLTRAVAEAASHPVLIGIDALKQPMLGWQIQESFAAEGAGGAAFSLHLASGSLGLGPLLDLPWLTNLINPADYQARTVGFGFESEGLTDSLVLRGKTAFIENDARTYLALRETTAMSTSGGSPLGSFMDVAEIRAGLLRNTAAVLSRGLYGYWTDIARAGSYYADDAIQQQIRLDRDVQTLGGRHPHRETEHAIAVILDDESPLYENCTSAFQNLAVLRQRIEGLELCGIPYRQYLLSDLQRADFPQYRCHLFPNLFKVDDEVIALLQRTALRNGALSIFGPGTGITDGKAISTSGAEALLGIPMQLFEMSSARRVRLRDRTHSALCAAGMPAVYGDSARYGPIVVPHLAKLEAAGVQSLGDAIFNWNVNTSGLALKEYGRGAAGNGCPGPRDADDYAVVFSGAVPLPPALLRSLAHYGGCNMWCDDQVALFASDSMVALHSTESKSYRINLPRRVAQVRDAATNNIVARDATHLELQIEPPDTHIFLLD